MGIIIIIGLTILVRLNTYKDYPPGLSSPISDMNSVEDHEYYDNNNVLSDSIDYEHYKIKFN